MLLSSQEPDRSHRHRSLSNGQVLETRLPVNVQRWANEVVDKATPALNRDPIQSETGVRAAPAHPQT